MLAQIEKPGGQNVCVFNALLSAIMVCIVSVCAQATSQGFHAVLPAQWLKRHITTWPVASPTVAVVAHRVRRIVNRITG